MFAILPMFGQQLVHLVAYRLEIAEEILDSMFKPMTFKPVALIQNVLQRQHSFISPFGGKTEKGF